MKRALLALVLLALPALAQERMDQAPCRMDGADCDPVPSYATMPAPSGCVATSVMFFGTPVTVGPQCDTGYTYTATTDTLAVPGTVSARNVTATALATPGSITVTPKLTQVASITTVAGSALVDGDYFTIKYGPGLTIPIQFDLSPGDGATGGMIPLLFTAGDSADTIRDNIILALNSAAPTKITASSGGAATVAIVLDTPGDVGDTNTENVGDAGFAVTGFADPTAATTVTYKLVACLADSTCTEAGAASSTAASTATLSASNFLRLTWSAVSGAATYKVYRTVAPTSPATTGIVYSGTALTVDDTGIVADGSTAPTVNGTGVVTAARTVTAALDVSGKLGVGVTGVPGANMEVWGTSYVYTLTAAANGAAVQFDSILNNASTVYGVYTNTVHKSSTGDVYGIIANVEKNTGRSGHVIGVEGYVSGPHKANDSRHYGLIGDNRAPANGMTGTVNVGSWNIAYGADTDIATLISDVPHGALPASGDYAIYSPDAAYVTYLAGPLMPIGGTFGSKTKVLTDASATAFATFTIADGAQWSGEIIYSVRSVDGTNLQIRKGRAQFTASREGTDYDADIAEIGTSTVSAKTGTLTGALEIGCAAGVCTLSANFDSSQTTPVLTGAFRFDSTDAGLALTFP